eukprot:8948309-Pyramimonas_sp.AAC.1
MKREKLRSAVAAPAEPSELEDGIVFLGLGHQHEHRVRARKTCVHAVALATQLFHIVKWRIDSGLPVHDAAIAAARITALHRPQA